MRIPAFSCVFLLAVCPPHWGEANIPRLRQERIFIILFFFFCTDDNCEVWALTNQWTWSSSLNKRTNLGRKLIAREHSGVVPPAVVLRRLPGKSTSIDDKKQRGEEQARTRYSSNERIFLHDLPRLQISRFFSDFLTPGSLNAGQLSMFFNTKNLVFRNWEALWPWTMDTEIKKVLAKNREILVSLDWSWRLLSEKITWCSTIWSQLLIQEIWSRWPGLKAQEDNLSTAGPRRQGNPNNVLLVVSLAVQPIKLLILVLPLSSYSVITCEDLLCL